MRNVRGRRIEYIVVFVESRVGLNEPLQLVAVGVAWWSTKRSCRAEAFVGVRMYMMARVMSALVIGMLAAYVLVC